LKTRIGGRSFVAGQANMCCVFCTGDLLGSLCGVGTQTLFVDICAQIGKASKQRDDEHILSWHPARSHRMNLLRSATYYFSVASYLPRGGVQSSLSWPRSKLFLLLLESLHTFFARYCTYIHIYCLKSYNHVGSHRHHRSQNAPSVVS
jgi:hypothetical protein